MLQCFASFRRALQCIDVCGVLQCDAMWSRTQFFGKGTEPIKISCCRHKAQHYTARQYTITHTDTLQTLQHAATHRYIHAPRFFGDDAEPVEIYFGECIPTHCNAQQYSATRCNTLQHTATHCNTLQHTATHCNIHAPYSLAMALSSSKSIVADSMQHTAMHDNTLQHAATHCNIHEPSSLAIALSPSKPMVADAPLIECE